MAGIYLHIPFCRKACHYCDFHFSTSEKLKEHVLKSMLSEIQTRAAALENEPVETIYFGGGTPSVLSGSELDALLGKIFEHYQVINNPEITLEANPDDLTAQKTEELKQTEINRLSIGIQSFRDEDLQYMNRIHTAQQADYSVKLVQDKGFENITIDLIYGTPTMPDEGWKENIMKAFDLNVPHISSYALTVENNTPLFHLIRRKKLENTDDSKTATQFYMLMEMMEENGFEQYEISNFCKHGFRSKHNSSYWEGKPYLGIGPSAHSFDGKKRRWNISSNIRYIQLMTDKLPYSEEETLSRKDFYNEYIMTGLRRAEGVSAPLIAQKFGSDFERFFHQELKNIRPSYYIEKNGNIVLTKAGKLVADRIASDLFYTD